MRDEGVIRNAAHEHFLESGDRVRWKTGHDAHSSYDVLRGSLTRYAYGRVGRSWQDAEDAVQEAYVHVLRTAKVNEHFNFGGLYKIWLDRSIQKIVMDRKRAGQVLVENQEIEDSDGLTTIDLAESDNPCPDLLLSMQSRVDGVMELSNNMKFKAKAIVRLSLIYGYSIGEVASMLEVDVKRVKNTLSYFRGML